MTQDQQRKLVLVGATSTIAEHCARLWLREGCVAEMVLIGRDLGRLEHLAEDLRVRAAAARIRCIVGDFSMPSEIQRLADDACTERVPDLVLIAHGTLPDQQACQADLAGAMQVMQINGLSPALFAEAFVSRMLPRNQGVLGLIGSVAGDRGRKSNYVYGAAKSLLERYAQGLQHRLAASGVRVCLIKPGPTDTPMTAALKSSGAKLASVDAVAADIVRGMARGRPQIYTPIKWWPIMMVIRHLPRWVFNRLDI